MIRAERERQRTSEAALGRGCGLIVLDVVKVLGGGFSSLVFHTIKNYPQGHLAF